MAREKNRNWLLLITVFLFVTSLFVLYISISREMRKDSCLFNGIYYKEGDILEGYKEFANCRCFGAEGVKCEDEKRVLSYDSFNTENLDFSYAFVRKLERGSDSSKVSLGDVNHNPHSIYVYFERESYCTSDGNPPVQTGFYELRENALVLTTLTNRDTSVYDTPCLISNIYTILDITIPKLDSFSIMYRSEEGKLFDLNSCYYNGTLYGIGDVFESISKQQICTCEPSTVKCN